MLNSIRSKRLFNRRCQATRDAACEVLEARRLWSVNFTFSAGALVISDNDDVSSGTADIVAYRAGAGGSLGFIYFLQGGMPLKQDPGNPSKMIQDPTVAKTFFGVGSLTINGNGNNDDLSADSTFDTNLGSQTPIGITLVGGSGADTLNGSSRADSLLGDASSDSIIGETGDDTIRGGDQGDYVDASGGNDRVYGDGGDDSLLGSDGTDSMEGGGGNDTLRGGNHNDTLYGGSGTDLLDGSGGTDDGDDDGVDTLVSIENPF